MLIGDQIRLRPLERADIPLFVRWLNDQEVIQYLSHYGHMSQAQEEAWFDNLKNLSVVEQPLMMEVPEGQNWKPIGDISFMSFDQQSLNAEIGLFIGEKDYWSKGYGTKAISMMLDYGFGTLNLHRIYLRVYDMNKRGIRCYEKLGFKHEGVAREAQYQNGKYIDVLWMGILKDEWKGSDK